MIWKKTCWFTNQDFWDQFYHHSDWIFLFFAWQIHLPTHATGFPQPWGILRYISVGWQCTCWLASNKLRRYFSFQISGIHLSLRTQFTSPFWRPKQWFVKKILRCAGDLSFPQIFLGTQNFWLLRKLRFEAEGMMLRMVEAWYQPTMLHVTTLLLPPWDGRAEFCQDVCGRLHGEIDKASFHIFTGWWWWWTKIWWIT